MVGGDVLPGPMPRECLNLLTNLAPPAHFLRGNCELAILHTHMQFDRTIGTTRVVNAGSIGEPFGAPGAHWLLLGPDVRFMHTSYDLVNTATRIRTTGYPTADEYANALLHPSSEQSMLDMLTPAGINPFSTGDPQDLST